MKSKEAILEKIDSIKVDRENYRGTAKYYRKKQMEALLWVLGKKLVI